MVTRLIADNLEYFELIIAIDTTVLVDGFVGAGGRLWVPANKNPNLFGLGL